MKIKPLTNEQLIIAVDRLTRFKEPEVKYLRVFKDIILNNLIVPKYRKHDVDGMDYLTLKNIAQDIINFTLENPKDLSINKKLLEYENSVFNMDENTKILLDNEINYYGIIEKLPDDIPMNLKFLKSIADGTESDCCFPVKKIILCEGITEEILLPEFARLCGFDFNTNGIYIISAGGKNQVVKYFYNYSSILKIPIFVLLDNDAKENLAQIRPKLRSSDKIHLVKSGEFEDLLPDSLIIKTLNYATKNISEADYESLKQCNSNAEFLKEFFRHRGMHEFKKAEFAHLVKKNISSVRDLSEEIAEIIREISTRETSVV